MGPRGSYGPEGVNPYKNIQPPPSPPTIKKVSLPLFEIPPGRLFGKDKPKNKQPSEEKQVGPRDSNGLEGGHPCKFFTIPHHPTSIQPTLLKRRGSPQPLPLLQISLPTPQSITPEQTALYHSLILLQEA